MTKHEFKIWLVTNGYTQRSLAAKLGLTDRTVSQWCSNERFPAWLTFALLGLEKGADR